MRRALFEVAFTAARPAFPDHGYYLQVKERLGAKRAHLSVARRLARRVHHILHRLGDAAFGKVT